MNGCNTTLEPVGKTDRFIMKFGEVKKYDIIEFFQRPEAVQPVAP